MVKIRKLWTKVKEGIWLYPLLYGLVSFFAAVLVVLIDSRYFSGVQQFIPSLFFTSVELAKIVLGIIAGSFITITTFTFSTTMVVLMMYSSQFSPRTVENFLTNQSTMQVFGIFVGGFIYSIVSLLFMRDVISEYMVVAASIGVLYMIAGLAYFSLFINNVATLIQVNNLIERLYKDSIVKINEYNDRVKTGTVESTMKIYPHRQSLEIPSPQNGYIQLVDHAGIVKLAQKIGAIIVFEKVVGQFVTDSTLLFFVHYKLGAPPDESVTTNLLSCIVIGARKSEKQDFVFTIQKIVEVALRAISTGTNDPNTANHCIRILGVLLGCLANIQKGYILMRKEEDGEAMAIFKAASFQMILYDVFSQIIHYANKDVSVIITIFKALRFAMEKASEENRAVILDFSEYIWGKIPFEDAVDLDYRMMKHEKESLLVTPL